MINAQGSLNLEDHRSLRDVLRPPPPRSANASCIMLPADADTFMFKTGVIQLLPSYHGTEQGNPYLHIKGFEEVCSTCYDGKTMLNFICLKLFPFSLKDVAKNWLNSLPMHSIDSWLLLQAKFLKRFFPLHMTQGLKEQISNFAQRKSESFARA